MKYLPHYLIRYRYHPTTGNLNIFTVLVSADSVEEASEVFKELVKNVGLEDKLEIRSISYKGVIYMK